jgi:hypothetical protein
MNKVLNNISDAEIDYLKKIVLLYHDSPLVNKGKAMHQLYDYIKSGGYKCAYSLALIEDVKTVKDHTLRPASTLFLPLYQKDYYKKYINSKELLKNIFECSKIICEITKPEHTRLTNLKVITKNLYKVTNIKVFNIDKDTVETEYCTPGFDYLLPEIQKDLTDIEISLGYTKEI